MKTPSFHFLESIIVEEDIALENLLNNNAVLDISLKKSKTLRIKYSLSYRWSQVILTSCSNLRHRSTTNLLQ